MFGTAVIKRYKIVYIYIYRNLIADGMHTLVMMKIWPYITNTKSTSISGIYLYPKIDYRYMLLYSVHPQACYFCYILCAVHAIHLQSIKVFFICVGSYCYNHFIILVFCYFQVSQANDLLVFDGCVHLIGGRIRYIHIAMIIVVLLHFLCAVSMLGWGIYALHNATPGGSHSQTHRLKY